MARLRINLPEKFSFSCLLPVRITDLNYGDHVGNDAFVSILHEARVQFLASKGYSSELNVDGNGLIMADLEIVFKSESFYRDILKIEMAVQNIADSSFDLYYKISTERKNTVIIVHAKTAQVCYDYQEKKISQVFK